MMIYPAMCQMTAIKVKHALAAHVRLTKPAMKTTAAIVVMFVSTVTVLRDVNPVKTVPIMKHVLAIFAKSHQSMPVRLTAIAIPASRAEIISADLKKIIHATQTKIATMAKFVKTIFVLNSNVQLTLTAVPIKFAKPVPA
jgi:hypothetical protein